MNKPQKQTVYLPVSDFNSSERAICTIGIPDLYGDKVVEQEGYFFTPEQLNEYTANVIRQALETAAEKAEIKERKVTYSSSSGSEYGYVQSINKQSIKNTFEETYQKLKV